MEPLDMFGLCMGEVVWFDTRHCILFTMVFVSIMLSIANGSVDGSESGWAGSIKND